MKYITLFVLVISIQSGLLAQNLVIEKQLLASDNQEPVPYATIIDITSNKYGTTSDETGKFKLVLPPASTKNVLYISSVGYKDTTIRVSDLSDKDVILLTPDPVQLETFTIVAGDNRIYEIGSSDSDVWSSGGEAISYEASAGFSWGVYFKTKKKQKGVLESISLYITDIGFPEAPIALRFFEFTGKFEFYRQQSRDLFRDLYSEPLIITAKKSGWFTVDLSEYNIPIPKGGIYCLLTPIDKGEQYFYDTPNGRKYGAAIGIYKTGEFSKQIYPIVQGQDNLGVLKKSNGPAVAIKYRRAR